MAYKRISPQPVVEGGTGAITLTGVLTGNGTSAITANAVTQYGTIVAGASNAVSSISPSATSGVPYISQGNAANPTFGTAVVAGGGTGNTTFTAFSLITAGTTATGAFQNVVGTGTTGQLLVAVTGGLPVWTAAGTASSISITGNTGGALTGNAFTFSGGTTGLSFGGAGSTETLTFAGITANAGVVNLGTDATDNAVNIGTAANNGRTITIGNTTLATGIVERVGTGNFSLDGVASSTYAIGASTTTGTTTIGGTAQTGTITLGSSSGTNIVAIGAGAGATTVNIANGVSGNTISIGNGVNTSAQVVNISSGAAGANSTVNILNGVSTTGTQTVNIATGAAASTVNIGNSTGASGFVQKVGTGNWSVNGAASSTYNLGAATTTGTITIGGTAQTGTITVGSSSGTSILNLGTGSGANAVNIGTSGTGAVSIGNSTGNTSVTGTLTASGNIITSTGLLSLPTTTSTAGQVTINSIRVLHGYGDSAGQTNTWVGPNAGNFTMTNGTAQQNTGCGFEAGKGLTTGAYNTFLGAATGYNITTGSKNIAIGYNSSSNYTSSESSNIQIGYNATGTAAESNVLRIGNGTGTSDGNLNKSYIYGIYNTSNGATQNLVSIDSTSQLGGLPYVTTSTWTPVLQFGGSTTGITYTTQKGYYTQMGNMVTYVVNIVLSSKGAQTGNATITGMPVAHGAADLIYPSGVFYPTNPATLATAGIPMWYLQTNVLNLIEYVPSTAATAALTNTYFANTTGINITGTYFIGF